MAKAVGGVRGEGKGGIGGEVDMAIEVVMEIIRMDMDITKVDMVDSAVLFVIIFFPNTQFLS